MQDPVCGAHLEEIDTAVLTSYAGEILAFCSQKCLDHFCEDPEVYAPNGQIVAHAS